MSLVIKEIIRTARAHFIDLLPEFPAKSDDVRLEEIEREGSNWAVTFGVPASSSNSHQEMIESQLNGPFGRRRIAKIIIVDGNSGQLVARRQRAA
jgi:hypothetical protein